MSSRAIKSTYSGMNDPDREGSYGAPVVLPESLARFAPPVIADLAVEWQGLEAARQTYPQLDITAQQTWLVLEHGHLSTFSHLKDGFFTIRLTASKHGPSGLDMLEGRDRKGHPCHPKTHQLTVNNRKKMDSESREQIAFMFLVDIRKALLLSHLAEARRNARDGTEYLLFDVMTPGVEKCYERLRT